MKPLSHPAVEVVTVEGILHALSDPVRVAIFIQIASSECSKTCSHFLRVRDQTIPKSTLSQHFKVLRDAGLIQSERRGVELQSTSRRGEIDQRFPGLIAAIIKAHQVQSSTRSKSLNGAKRNQQGSQGDADDDDCFVDTHRFADSNNSTRLNRSDL